MTLNIDFSSAPITDAREDENDKETNDTVQYKSNIVRNMNGIIDPQKDSIGDKCKNYSGDT